jgi:deoxyribodipyrimidine photo-lyase
MTEPPVLVWLRRDLRVADNPALLAAIRTRSPVVPVFIWAPEEEAPWSPGSASRWWLHQSLNALGESFRQCGSKLIVRRGPSRKTLVSLAAETGATTVYWNRLYEPAALARDRKVQEALRQSGFTAETFPGNVLFEPGTILNRSNLPFVVFTAFWKACLRAPAPARPDKAPDSIPAPRRWPRSLSVTDLELEPVTDWAAGLRQTWEPGERGAAKQIKAFLKGAIQLYFEARDQPAARGTSRLSPHLHFGEISPWHAWHTAWRCRDSSARDAYLRQLVWREFAHHLLFHYPRTPAEPLRSEFRAFPWRKNAKMLKAWTRGQTGYPLVDAGMRELWHTGWMHNRVRMVAASFLVKHLLIPWQEGAAWFWDTLVDADLANNTLGWQWVAGCGADAAPYFRIFNPARQEAQFDPGGAYVRHWVPELQRAPATYPRPIVGHPAARARALAALAGMRRSRRS